MENVFTIVSKSKGHHDEGVAGTAILPGAAIELQADGEYDAQVSAQAAALKGELLIAKEDALQGKTIEEAYAIGDVVFFYTPLPGDHIHLLVKAGEDIDVNDKLVVEGGTSGLFVEAAGTEAKFQFVAIESTGGTLAANGHVMCRAL